MGPVPASRATRAALYAGGFIGPFGGGMVVVLVPELRDAFGISTGLASLALTVYLVPFAVLLWAGLNTLMVGAAPATAAGRSRSSARSSSAANALAPLIWVPVYAAEPMLAFTGAGRAPPWWRSPRGAPLSPRKARSTPDRRRPRARARRPSSARRSRRAARAWWRRTPS